MASFTSFFRKNYYRLLGMQIGKGTNLPKISITWPHQVEIGNNCQLEPNILFKYDGIWKKGPSIIINENVFLGANCEFNITDRIIIGKDSMIASGCKFIDHNHSTELLPKSERQPDTKKAIIIGKDVWLGVNVVVLSGVSLGDGCIIGGGAVVTKSIPSFEIWGGIPAKKIGMRRLVV
ncbi:acyltransferase [Maribacter stanieri]|uniref:acyltransferase n=1 Tax=Maribacter stanieri TaxID=440514 RepID=UPI0024947725|nr:acyltransferase [Maribacter stanieri]